MFQLLNHIWKLHICIYSRIIKMESTLFVPVNLSFSENLRCLKMPLLVGAISQKRWPSETCFVFAGQNVNSGKFKHLKYSENVKFTGTNYIDSILIGIFESFLKSSFLNGFLSILTVCTWFFNSTEVYFSQEKPKMKEILPF